MIGICRRTFGVVLACAAVGAGAPAIAADGWQTVARKFGEAYALAENCGSATVNVERMGIYSAALGLDIDETFKTVVTISHDKTLTTIVDASEADVCNLATWRYGAEGTEGPGLIDMR